MIVSWNETGLAIFGNTTHFWSFPRSLSTEDRHPNSDPYDPYVFFCHSCQRNVFSWPSHSGFLCTSLAFCVCVSVSVFAHRQEGHDKLQHVIEGTCYLCHSDLQNTSFLHRETYYRMYYSIYYFVPTISSHPSWWMKLWSFTTVISFVLSMHKVDTAKIHYHNWKQTIKTSFRKRPKAFIFK